MSSFFSPSSEVHPTQPRVELYMRRLDELEAAVEKGKCNIRYYTPSSQVIGYSGKKADSDVGEEEEEEDMDDGDDATRVDGSDMQLEEGGFLEDSTDR